MSSHSCAYHPRTCVQCCRFESLLRQLIFLAKITELYVYVLCWIWRLEVWNYVHRVCHICKNAHMHIFYAPFNGHTLGTVHNSTANVTTKECQCSRHQQCYRDFPEGSTANCSWHWTVKICFGSYRWCKSQHITIPNSSRQQCILYIVYI